METLQFWMNTTDKFYDMKPLDADVLCNTRSNPAVGRRANIFPADSEPFTCSLHGDSTGKTCEDLFSDMGNPFDKPIEELLDECNI